MQNAASGAPSRPPHRIRYDLTGCHHAAILLERIQYWTPRTRVRLKGEAWIVKSRSDLAKETGLSDKQTRGALEALKRRDIVETVQKPFAGKNVTHLRLTARGVIQMRDAGLLKPGELALQGRPELAPEGQPEMALQGQLHTQGDIDKGVYTSGYMAETSNEVPAIAEPVSEAITGKEPDMTPSIPRKGLKAPTPLPPAPKAKLTSADVLAKLQERGKGVPAPKKGKKLSLGAVWQDACAKTYPGEFHPGLTPTRPTPRLDTL